MRRLSTTVVHCAFPNYTMAMDGPGLLKCPRLPFDGRRGGPWCVSGSDDMVGFEGYLMVPYVYRILLSVPGGASKSLSQASMSRLHARIPYKGAH